MSRGTIKVIRSPARSRASHLDRLASAGHTVDARPIKGPADLRRLGSRPPTAGVIDLGRAPSYGCDLALWLRQRKATRGVPIVFVGGDPDKVARIKTLLPDAAYTTWAGVRGALKRAIAKPPAAAVRPASALAGYSGTPLPKKLGIKEGSCVVLIGAPARFERTLGDLPPDVTLRTGNRRARDLSLWFVRRRRELDRGMPRMARSIGETRLWIIWPKKTSPLASDVTQVEVRAAELAAGLVDFKVCAVDADWSGLAFVRRKIKK